MEIPLAVALDKLVYIIFLRNGSAVECLMKD